jgi:hypothetical protein
MSDSKEILERLEWFIENDDCQDIPSNEYWINGLEKAREAVSKYKGEPYEPLEWDNWEPGIDTCRT